jgi:alcohol dehydrogenase, propanol-preferring
VGRVVEAGPASDRFAPGTRVGIAWLRQTCGVCEYCRSGRENLCPNALFTGWDRDGGYAEFALVPEAFAYRLPDAIDDEHAAPLLCAGIIGYRAIKRADIRPRAVVGLYGFGGSAHLALQVLRHRNCRVFVMSRGGVHRRLAEQLGADWIGDASETPPQPLDAAILFAPAGELVPPIMSALRPGGVLAIAGIHLSQIPPLDYARQLFGEKEIRSVTADTRADAEEFLRVAGEIPIASVTVGMRLEDANRALNMLKHDELRGAAVLHA